MQPCTESARMGIYQGKCDEELERVSLNPAEGVVLY